MLWMDHTVFIHHLSVSGHEAYFCLLTAMNHASGNTGVQAPLQDGFPFYWV